MDIRQTLAALASRRAKVLVVGLGISGIESARFLSRIGACPVVVEREEEGRYRARSKFGASLEALREAGIALHFGIEGESIAPLLAGVELAILSPGVSLESAVVGALRRRAIPLISELELGVEAHGGEAVVVTGSNGKSTTVTLIHHILRHAGLPAQLCGNVGVPVVAGLSLDQRAATSEERLVVEASSYQLESCAVLAPKVAVLLNLSDNHLERHGSMERYFTAKAQLFSEQGEGHFAVLNRDDPWVMRLAARVASSVLTFGVGSAPTHGDGAWISYAPASGQDRITVRFGEECTQLDLSTCSLLGLHNRYNCAAAALACRAMGVASETIAEALQSFSPLTHRLEQLGESHRGALLINDSKSTTVAATVAAIRTVQEAFPQRRLVLLIGGLAKAGSWDPVLEALQERSDSLEPVRCFGKDATLLASHCRARSLPHQVHPTLAAATNSALAESDRSHVILLSPGCASFDEFSDFEHRGDVFKSLVREESLNAASASMR